MCPDISVSAHLLTEEKLLYIVAENILQKSWEWLRNRETLTGVDDQGSIRHCGCQRTLERRHRQETRPTIKGQSLATAKRVKQRDEDLNNGR
jgi:hypothetical protein